MEEYEETKDKEGRHFKVKVGNVEVGILEVKGLYYFKFTNYGSTKERAEAISKANENYMLENFMY